MAYRARYDTKPPTWINKSATCARNIRRITENGGKLKVFFFCATIFTAYGLFHFFLLSSPIDHDAAFCAENSVYKLKWY